MSVKLNLNSNHNIFKQAAAKKAEKKEDTKTEKTSKEETDKVDVKSNKESFDEIFAEMRANVPDRTSTIEEKELALEYIDRILKSDADDDVKGYWAQKKTEIQGEIERIRAEQSSVNTDSDMPEFKKIWAEMCANIPDSTTTIEEKELALEYIQKILESDATPDIKQSWQGKAEIIQAEINQIKEAEKKASNTDQTNDVDNNDKQTYAEVYREMRLNVPNPTTTKAEKQLALEYIDKLLNSTDISPFLAKQWENTAKELEQEIKQIEKEEVKKQKSFDELWTKIQEYSASDLKTPKEKETLNTILSGIVSSDNVNSFEKLFWQRKLQNV